MTKAEYIVTKYWCNVRCTPIENKCKCCSILKYFKEYEQRIQAKGLDS